MATVFGPEEILPPKPKPKPKPTEQAKDLFEPKSEPYADFPPSPEIPDSPEYHGGTETQDDADGLPISRGYYDEDGTWVETENLQALNDQLRAIRDAEFPGFTEWSQQEGVSLTDIQASDPYQELMRLARELESGPTDEDLQGGLDYGQDYAARLTGLDDRYRDILSGMADELFGGVGAQPGMTDDQRQVYERAVQSQIEGMERQAEKTLNAMVVNGSAAMAMYAKSDEAMRAIRDTRIQGAVAIVDEDFQRQMANFESKKLYYDQLVASGDIGAAQYLDMIQQGKASSLYGYAQGITAIAQQNQEYFQMYAADYKALADGVQNQYDGIMLELGVDKALSEQIQADLDLFYYDYNKELERYALELGQWQTEVAIIQAERARRDAKRQGVWNNVFGAIFAVAAVVLLFTPAAPLGAAALAAKAAAANK